MAVSADLRDSAGGSNRELRDLAELLDLENQPFVVDFFHG